MDLRFTYAFIASLAAVACSLSEQGPSSTGTEPSSEDSPDEDTEPSSPASTSSSSSSTSSTSSSSSSSGSSSGGTTSNKPTSLTITAKLGTVKPVHILSSDKKRIVSAVSLAGAPSFSPSKPSELPTVTKAAKITITSPSLGGCAPNTAFALNGSQVSVSITAEDTLPSAACSKWTDAVAASGLRVTLDDVPYPNGGKADVDIRFSP